MDMLKTSRDEDNRRRDEAQLYGLQQQVDELRRQLKENLARQQWFEELYKQNEGKVSQVQLSQDRLTHDVAQSMHARQMEDTRVKAQLADLIQKAESPEKQLKDLRAQLNALSESRKTDRDVDSASQKQMEELQGQIREINSHIGQVSDSQRQLRDVIQELDAALGEVRQEALHVSELQTMEEQRLRRHGMELQGMFEALRQQFGDVSAKSQRVDDVRRQLTERVEAVEERLGTVVTEGTSQAIDLDRVEKIAGEQYLLQQERLETVRVQLEAQLSEQRSVNDQRMDRIMSRFNGIDERLRTLEQGLSELPSRFDALERRGDLIGVEADMIEEWLVGRQIKALEDILEDARARRSERASNIGVTSRSKPQPAPGSVFNPAGLIKSVRDAKPPVAQSDVPKENPNLLPATDDDKPHGSGRTRGDK
jgi:chromosome segregation ATPase